MGLELHFITPAATVGPYLPCYQQDNTSWLHGWNFSVIILRKIRDPQVLFVVSLSATSQLFPNRKWELLLIDLLTSIPIDA